MCLGDCEGFRFFLLKAPVPFSNYLSKDGRILLNQFPYFCCCLVNLFRWSLYPMYFIQLHFQSSWKFIRERSMSISRRPYLRLYTRWKPKHRARNPSKVYVSMKTKDRFHVSLLRGFVHHLHQVIWSFLKMEFSFIPYDPWTKEALKVNYKTSHLPACWSDLYYFWWCVCVKRMLPCSKKCYFVIFPFSGAYL